MKLRNIILIPAILLAYDAYGATKCSRANLTKCLDSVCALNVSSNPAARCQYCGTSNAGTPPKSKMRSVSAGASAKYNISEKDLKKAPSDPGKRYAWATQQCIKKVAGCTADDVTDAYDSLIEQSCKAAGVSSQLSKTLKETSKKKSEASCTTTIQSCLISNTHCGADYRNCKSDSDFDKFFSGCSVDAAGCDDYVSPIRAKLLSNRDNAVKNTDAALTTLTESYQSARAKKLANAKSGCADNSARDNCINTVCGRNMPNKCDGEFGADERVAATALCKFYDTACATVD
ncbi:MAG: hypothetical protein IJE79_03905 [Alphaproteobacteria bacterium]|nr:hypothetical protein [Alphaproteobacteria bacterium]